MNGYQVQDSWMKHAAAQRQQTAQRSSERMRAAEQWVARSFPSLCDDGHPDPFVLLATINLKTDAPDQPVTKAQVLDYTRDYHVGRHRLGRIDDQELADELSRLEQAVAA